MKKFSILLIIFAFLFLAFYKSDTIYIEGHWTAEKVIFNGEEVYKNDRKPFDGFEIPVTAEIDRRVDSISIHNARDTINASFKIRYDEEKPYVIMKSNNAILNGHFEMDIDTIYDDYIYSISVKLQSKSTYLHLWRKEHSEPRKKFVPLQKGRP